MTEGCMFFKGDEQENQKKPDCGVVHEYVISSGLLFLTYRWDAAAGNNAKQIAKISENF